LLGLLGVGLASAVACMSAAADTMLLAITSGCSISWLGGAWEVAPEAGAGLASADAEVVWSVGVRFKSTAGVFGGTAGGKLAGGCSAEDVRTGYSAMEATRGGGVCGDGGVA